MKLTLHVWRQPSATAAGRMVTYTAADVSPDMSFLEMLDVVNEGLIAAGDDPIAFDHDCREGICGMCGLVINGIAHGPQRATTTCQLHMRHFADGDTIYVEPWRAGPFPVIKDLVVDRDAFDRIIEAGGYISANTGGARTPMPSSFPRPPPTAPWTPPRALAAARAWPRVPTHRRCCSPRPRSTHLGSLPQGQPERRTAGSINMVATMDELGFGNCTNIGECAAVCPKEIGLDTIATLNRDLIKASLRPRP